MEKKYKLVFVYPDGHLEEIENLFNNGKDALEYGNNLLGQVINTEGLRSHKSYYDISDDVFARDPIDPYFMIVEIEQKKYRLVYDSRQK